MSKAANQFAFLSCNLYTANFMLYPSSLELCTVACCELLKLPCVAGINPYTIYIYFKVTALPNVGGNLRNRTMAVAGDDLHQPRRSYFFTKVVMSICGQPIVAVDEGDKGEGFGKAGKLQLLKH